MGRPSRHLAGGSALLVLAFLCALAAPPAGARETTHSFTGNHTGEVRAIASGTLEFAFGPFVITCKKARSVKTGAHAVFPRPTLYLALNFTKCTNQAVKINNRSFPAGPATFEQALDIEYHANRYAEIGSRSTAADELKGAKAIEIVTGGGSGCVISWAAQTVPAGAAEDPNLEYEAVLFETLREKTEELQHYPNGERETLAVKNELTKMSFTLEAGVCAETGKGELKSGTFEGALHAEVHHADLGWE